jgi:non-ribosomal peptide synthetase component F/acyl carrier protein
MASIEELIQQRLRAKAGTRRAIGRADRGQPLPLSAGQQQMWFLHRFDPASSAYLMSWVLRVHGPLDAEGLRWAWEKVVHRHEILRTRYAGDDQPAQIVDPPGRFELRVIDLAGEPANRREQRARRIAERERKRPFDLTEQHPVRVTLIVVDPEQHLVVVTIHHIACDGPSYPRIAAELGAYYAEHVTGRPARLPDVDLQYADFAAWELSRRTDGGLRGHLDYWRQALAGVTELPLPTDRPRPARPSARGGAVDVAIKPETSERLRALAAEHRASPYMAMLAAFHGTLGHLSGSGDVAVGVPVSARTVPQLDDLVGYLVNTVVVRSRQAEEHTFADLLRQVRDRFLDAFDHRAAPFKWVVDELHPVRAAGLSPLFRAGFDMDPADPGAFQLEGLRVEQLGLSDSPAAKFDLTLHVEEWFDNRLFARLEYAAAVIDEPTAQAWAGYCEALLDAVAREPHEPLGRIRERLAAQGRLPAPAGAALTAQSGAVAEPVVVGAPAAELIDRIRRIWCTVLDISDLDTTDNFFDVGGDSLRAVALAGRLREDGLDVSAADIFAHQTIEELAEACAGQPGTTVPPVSVAPFALLSTEDRAALPPDVEDAYPLAATQLGMIIELRARPDVNTYQDSTSYLIRDGAKFDAGALQRAAQLVVDRHEVLRTTFDLNSYSVPLQLVHSAATITVGVTDHGTLGPAGWRSRLEEYAASERRSPIDLAYAPLIRVHAHTAEDRPEWWITITECHPILEGWSFHTMLMEILTAYREIHSGRRPGPPEPVAFRYADYVAAEAAARHSEEHRAYWRSVVQGRVDASLPTAWQDGRDTPRDRYQHLVYFRDLDADLRRLATETRTSMKAVLLAAHLKVMSMVFGSADFFTGLVCDARPEVPGADRVLGMYLNTVPFAMPAGARSWAELVRAVYDDLTAMWPHRFYPMHLVQQELGGSGRLLDVFFNYLDFHQVDGKLIDEEQTYNDNDNEFALHVFTLPGILKLNTTNHRLSREAAVRLASLYRTVLEEMSIDPDADPGSACLPPAERARVCAPVHNGAAGPEPAGVLESFARVVRDQPDSPAVRCDGQSLTYRQLDTSVDATAQQLRDRGVGPGHLVAVAPRRALDTLATLLAIWKAGAAWALVEPPPLTVDLAQAATAGVACVISGAAFTHRALAYALETACGGLDALGAGPEPGTSWVCAAPLASIEALTALLLPLTRGGAAVITAAELPDALPELRDLIAAGEVTHLRSTGLVAERVLDGGLPAGITAIVSGDQPAARPAGPGRWIPAIEVGALPGWVALDGRPLPGVGVRVVDDERQPVPTGVAGELCLSGAGLAEHCHADPAGTAERFVPDPTGSAGSRLYRTGLLARFLDDGTLEQLGPVEQRARVDGHRTEPYRTRELLDAQPAIVDSYVVGQADPARGRHRLVGHVRTVADVPFDADRIRKALAESRTPRHLIPDVLIQVDSWPMTNAGIVDLDRLPELPDVTGGAAAEERPWDDEFENLLRDMLASVSYAGDITPDASLADSGLTSFATVGLLVALEQTYGITIPDDVPFADMFRTPRSLWEMVEALRNAG